MIEDVVLNPLTAEFQLERDRTRFVATCTALEVVGDLVYRSAPGTVETADPTDLSTMPVIGIIVAKGSPTSCVVQFAGEVTGLSGLTVGERYYVGLAGVPVTPIPSPPPLDKVYIQQIGVALETTVLLLRPLGVIYRRDG